MPMINDIQSGKIFSPDGILNIFKNFFNLLAQLNIGNFNDTTFEFTDSYFANTKIQFLLPVFYDISLDSFEFFKLTVVASFEKMLNMVLELQEGMDRLLSDSNIKNMIKEANRSELENLLKDFKRYNNSHVGNDATIYVKPQLDYHFCKDINSDISNKKDRLGPRNGITTTNEQGELRYATTAVVAVTARRWISHLIEKITISEELKDSNGKPFFDTDKIPVKSQQALLRKALFNQLYKNNTDTKATIQTYLLVDRNQVAEAIDTTCKPNNTISDVVTEIVNHLK